MGELAAALAVLQTRLPHIGKDNAAVIQPKEGGRTYGYKYADLATVSKAILPLLGELGLSFYCAPTIRDDGKFVLEYALQHANDHEQIEGFYPLPTGSPQQIGSAITYARRYCLCAVTGAAPDEDDDDGAAAERADGLPVNADGSLSRSRTTDEEKAAAGVMTGPQLAAHNKLRREGELDPQRVEKLSTTPDDDEFYEPRQPVRAKPAGWLLSERFAALGVFDRKERLDQCSEIVGRPISSSNELEPGEVAAVLEALQKRELAS